MDKRLFEAARLGNVGELHSMLEADPLLLERVSVARLAETPLHIASLAGKTGFVREIVRLKPSFAWDLDKDGLSPLHIASALGDIETARVLLGSVGKDLCLLRDNDGRTPLHHAAMKGQVAVIEELASECSDTIKEVTAEGDTALHLAVKDKKFESLKALVQQLGDKRSEVLAIKNEDGFTIFQLAKATNQKQVLTLLRSHEADPQGSESSEPGTGSRWNEKFLNFLVGYFEVLSWPAGIDYGKDTGVVATLIATVTYQAAVAPPNFVLKENMKLDPKCADLSLSFKSKPKGCRSVTPLSYMFTNTVGFMSSLVPLIAPKPGPISNVSILVAFFGLIASYITQLVAMSSGLLPVFYLLVLSCMGFLITFSLGYAAPKMLKILRRHQSLARRARQSHGLAP